MVFMIVLSDNTVYHDRFKAEKFCGFRGFCMSMKLFYTKIQLDLRGSMRDSVNVFSQLSECTTCCKTFASKLYGIR